MAGGTGAARRYLIPGDLEAEIVFVSGNCQRTDMEAAGWSRTDLAAGVALDTVESIRVGPGPGGIDDMAGVGALGQRSTGDLVVDRPASVEVIHRCVSGQSRIEVTFTATTADIGGISQMLGMTPVRRRGSMTDGAVRRSSPPDR